MRGHSVGGFGSVATNRIIATVLGDLFHLRVQAYPLYGSEKKGLPTTYYLTVADGPIRTHAELSHVDFVPLNDVNAFRLGNPLEGLIAGGLLFVQSTRTDPTAIWGEIPAHARRTIVEKGIRVLALDTVRIAREVATRPELAQRMRGSCASASSCGRRRSQARDRAGCVRGGGAVAPESFGKRGEQVIRIT
jgi:pyruvate-ferredoxin/flavodoxin oxidoreductase